MFKLHISKRAQKELKKISQLHREALLNALEEIKNDPLFGKPLVNELSGRFSYRVGVYRIIYTVNKKDKVVKIISAGHRSNIYN